MFPSRLSAKSAKPGDIDRKPPTSAPTRALSLERPLPGGFSSSRAARALKHLSCRIASEPLAKPRSWCVRGRNPSQAGVG